MNRGNRGLVILPVALVLAFLIETPHRRRYDGAGYDVRLRTMGGASRSGWTWDLTVGLKSLSMLAFSGALIVGVVMLVLWLDGRVVRETPGTDANLPRRYAAGEISREEYEARCKILEE